MRVTLLNGNPEVENEAFDRFAATLGEALGQRGHELRAFTLRDLDVRPCTGCFGCWVKRPGRCIVDDDMEAIRHAYMASDLVLFGSPVKMGYVSSLLKRSIDKLIPLLLPYALVEGGELHHLPRYEAYPRLGMLIGRGEDTDEEDLEIIRTIGEGQARNLKTELALFLTTDVPGEEAADAIDRL